MPSEYGPVAVNVTTGALEYAASVGSSQITDASIATADLADGAVTVAKLASSAVTNAKVDASAAIAASKLSGVAATGSANVFTTHQAVQGEVRVDTDTISWVKYRSTGGTASAQVGSNQNTGETYIDWDLWNGGGDLLFRGGSAQTERARLLVGGGFEYPELAADPAAPAANKVRFYAKDNGSGKTGLYARFPTGAVQQVALEP